MPLAKAASQFASDRIDGPVHVATITRWITKGIKAGDGSVVRLAARRFPNGWRVSREAIDEFLDRLTSAALDDIRPVEAPTAISRRRRREQERAEAQAVALGL
jgi:hypothetical protein